MASDLIRDAIRNKQNISAVYRGRVRLLSPHALGYKNDVLHVLSVQYGGESSSGLGADPSENWRCMAVGALSEVSPAEGDFVTAANHKRPNTCIDAYVEEVSY